MKFIARFLYVPLAGLLVLTSCAKEETESYDKFENQALEAWMTQHRSDLVENLQSEGLYYIDLLDAGDLASDPINTEDIWVSFDFSGRDLSGNIILTRNADDAVLAQCDLFLNEGAALQEKTQKAQKSWAQKEQNLQAEAAQLQEKYQKGLITTNDAQAQQQSIEKRVASYQSSAQKEAQALDEENYVFTNRAQDLLHRAVQEINGDKKYKLIINATALIDADSTLNITPAVLAKVNELYAADKKAVKK